MAFDTHFVPGAVQADIRVADRTRAGYLNLFNTLLTITTMISHMRYMGRENEVAHYYYRAPTPLGHML